MKLLTFEFDILGRLQAHIDCRRRQRFKDQRRDQLVDRPRTDRLAAGVTVGRRELTLQRKGASNGVAAALAEDAVLALQGAIVLARPPDDNAVFDRAMQRTGTPTPSWTAYARQPTYPQPILPVRPVPPTNRAGPGKRV